MSINKNFQSVDDKDFFINQLEQSFNKSTETLKKYSTKKELLTKSYIQNIYAFNKIVYNFN